MSIIRQSCPSCSRLLELPDTAVGKTAKCPACLTLFAVPSGTQPVKSKPLEAAPTEGASKDASNPFSKPIGGSMGYEGHVFGGATPAPNPYQPSVSSDTTSVGIGELRIAARSIEEIFGVTMAIFKERWGSLVGAFLVVFCTSVAMFIASSVIGTVAQANGGQGVGAMVQMLTSLVTYPISAYLYLGLVRNALAVARNEPSPLNQLISPTQYFLRFLGGGVLLTFVFGAVIALIAGVMAAIAAVGGGGGEALAVGAIFLVAIVLIPLGMAAWWALWSWPLVIADGKGSVTTSFRAAYAITMGNKMTSLLMLVIAMVLSIAGLLACYVGQIVTTPITTLMMAIGYLMITNQPIQDPRMVLNQQFGPRPSTPTF